MSHVSCAYSRTPTTWTSARPARLPAGSTRGSTWPTCWSPVATRVASGGTRLVLAREKEILERFRGALGADGTQLALLLLRAGRGPL